MSINKGMYSGNLTKKPEFTENGTCFFTIASQRHFKNKDGNYEADFINLKAFNFNAEKLVANCDKGDAVSVTAHIQSGSYEKDGKTKIKSYK